MADRSRIRHRRRRALTGLIILACGLATGCEQAFATQTPAPILVTLPVSTPRPPASPTPTDVPPTPGPSPTPIPTETVPPTPIPRLQGIGATRLLWEWDIVARPSALAATATRLAVIIADGRFAWLSAETGRLETNAFLWPRVLEGESWGEVYTDGSVAVVAAGETSIDEETGLVDSRSRLVVYGVEARALWDLPDLTEPQHFYSATLAAGPGLVVVGKWPYGFEDNTLAAYELFTGQQLWSTEAGTVGYRQMVHDGTRLFVLLGDEGTSAVTAYDLRTGEELWRWSDEQVERPDRITLGGGSLYVLSATTTLALDPLSGDVQWAVGFSAAPEAGLGTRGDVIYLAPAPTVDLRYPGVVALQRGGKGVAWHSLSGLLADPLVIGEEALWTVVRSYTGGEVWLSGLDPDTGLEQIRLPLGDDPTALYRLAALGRRVYLLGDTLQAYGY
jgi:hypothetical protein